jgi:hypothetical protein
MAPSFSSKRLRQISARSALDLLVTRVVVRVLNESVKILNERVWVGDRNRQ